MRKATGRRHEQTAAPVDAAASRGIVDAQAADEWLDLQGALALLKTTRATLHRWMREGRVRGSKVGRQWRFTRRDLEHFMRGGSPRIEVASELRPELLRVAAAAAKIVGPTASPPPQEEEPVANAIRAVLWAATSVRASDVHLDAYDGDGVARLRIDGALRELVRVDARAISALVDRLMELSGCDPRERLRPQDGRINLSTPLGEGRKLDVRACFIPTATGVSATLRLLDPSAVLLDLSRIEFGSQDAQRLRRALADPSGLVVVTGPVGSGITTTLYACLSVMDRRSVKLVSVEDPVEYLLPGVMQVPVRAQAGVTFARALRSVLRADPDVIMVGSLRDAETLLVAQEAALTGHLVLSQMHARTAAEALLRMVDLCGSAFLVADATRLVLAQRLMRCTCRTCAEPERSPDSAMLQAAGEAARRAGLHWESMARGFLRPVGCVACAGTGYRGRTVAAETLVVSAEIGQALRQGRSVTELEALAIQQGMTPLAADAVRRAAEGRTTLAEAMRVTGLLA